LVADKDNKLVGHIMLTKTQITTSNSKVSALIIAPLCVAREERRQGIGSRLVEESCRLAVNLGYRIVFVVGNPAYYGRFGFKASAAFGIKHVPPIPDENVMVKALSSGALTGVSGTITFT
jgi:predicted N-acetyltransferase YhbS